MDDEDYIDVATEIIRQLRTVGLSEIGEVSNYVELGEDDARYPDSKYLVINMLKAFERHLSTEDYETYKQAMTTINSLLAEGEKPEKAIVTVPNELSWISGEQIDLSKSPKLTRLRQDLIELVSAIQEASE